MQILVNCMSDPSTQDSFFPPHVKDALSTCGNVTYARLSRNELREGLRDVDILFGGWGLPLFDDDMLTYANRLKLICYTGGSVAEQMTEAVPTRGIRMCSGNRLYAQSVAEGTIGYILAAQRRLVQQINETAQTGWAPFTQNDGIRYKTVGLIGFGMIVRELIPMLQVFGCRIGVCSDWYGEAEMATYGVEKWDMETLFRESDIVSLHESLREDTYHLIDSRYFAMMKPDALFVNTARGAIIVEEDLAAAAKSGHIRAILDVFEKEPLPMNSCLRGTDNILLVPHRGGPTMDVRAQVTLALIEDVKTFLRDGDNAVLRHEIPWAYAKHMTRHNVKK